MLDHVTIVNLIFAGLAAIFGLCSRSFLAALVAGLFVGLIHAGVVLLVGLQAGSLSLVELPYLKDGVDVAMKTLTEQTGPLTFAHARYAAYLLQAGLALWLVALAGFFLRTLFVLMGFGSQHTIHA